MTLRRPEDRRSDLWPPVQRSGACVHDLDTLSAHALLGANHIAISS